MVSRDSSISFETLGPACRIYCVLCSELDPTQIVLAKMRPRFSYKVYCLAKNKCKNCHRLKPIYGAFVQHILSILCELDNLEFKNL